MTDQNSPPLLSTRAIWLSPCLIGLFFAILLPLWNPEQKEMALRGAALLFMSEALLLILIIPLALQLPGRFDGPFLSAVLLATTTLFLMALLAEKGGAILQIQTSMLAFGVVLGELAYLSKKILPPLLAQLLITLLGFLILSSLVLTNLILSLSAQKTWIIQNLLTINPLPSGLNSLTGWDLFRFSWMYDFSHLSDYPYSYPPPWEIAKFYGKIGFFLLILCLGIHYKKKDKP